MSANRECLRCGMMKSLIEFPVAGGGHKMTCIPCIAEKKAEYRAAKKMADSITRHEVEQSTDPFLWRTFKQPIPTNWTTTQSKYTP